MATKKILYFKGAGYDEPEQNKQTDVGNPRIRTAFSDNKGKKIFMELRCNMTPKKLVGSDSTYFGIPCTVQYIVKDKNEENVFAENVFLKEKEFVYSISGILKFVNSIKNVHFDKIQVLRHLSGYSVFTENRERVNFGDEFVFDEGLFHRRVAIRNYFYELEKSEGKEFPAFSTWVDEYNSDIMHVLRHFEGYNKHWIIDATLDDWLKSMKQTHLNSPGVHGVAK